MGRLPTGRNREPGEEGLINYAANELVSTAAIWGKYFLKTALGYLSIKAVINANFSKDPEALAFAVAAIAIPSISFIRAYVHARGNVDRFGTDASIGAGGTFRQIIDDSLPIIGTFAGIVSELHSMTSSASLAAPLTIAAGNLITQLAG